jgi:hypothetical protein
MQEGIIEKQGEVDLEKWKSYSGLVLSRRMMAWLACEDSSWQIYITCYKYIFWAVPGRRTRPMNNGYFGGERRLLTSVQVVEDQRDSTCRQFSEE